MAQLICTKILYIYIYCHSKFPFDIIFNHIYIIYLTLYKIKIR